MKRILLYASAGLFAFLGFIIVFAPASLLYKTVATELNKIVPELQLVSMSKTVWSGGALLRYRNFPESELTWHLAPTPLVTANVFTDIRLKGDGHELQTHLQLNNAATLLDALEGTIGSSFINQESQNLGLTFTGELALQNINLSADRRWLTSITGNLHWTGGKIHYEPASPAGGFGNTPGQIFELPALDGALSLDGKVLVLEIIYQGMSLALVRLKPDGWAEISVKARLFDLANVPWPAGSSLDETVLKLEEQLFRGRS
ncbi:MAG: hypothetical protein ACI8W1_000981 [Candidatus Azotimanducaceae bacterium]|jgi:hypothetical protein